MLDSSKVKPLRDDVLIRHIPTHSASGNTIFFKEDVDASEFQFFEVVAVGPDTKLVTVGDTVVVSWKRVTEPMRMVHNGKTQQFGITAEKEIDCVVEV